MDGVGRSGPDVPSVLRSCGTGLLVGTLAGFVAALLAPRRPVPAVIPPVTPASGEKAIDGAAQRVHVASRVPGAAPTPRPGEPVVDLGARLGAVHGASA